MNKFLILLLSGVLTSAWSATAAADGQSEPSVMTKLMVLFSLRMPHVAVPQAVAAPEKDWAIVKDAKARQAERVANEQLLREAAQRVAERERELSLARQAYQQKTKRVAQGIQPAGGEDPLEAAALRMTQREQEAYRAKLDYSRVARTVREQRLRDSTVANADL